MSKIKLFNPLTNSNILRTYLLNVLNRLRNNCLFPPSWFKQISLFSFMSGLCDLDVEILGFSIFDDFILCFLYLIQFGLRQSVPKGIRMCLSGITFLINNWSQNSSVLFWFWFHLLVNFTRNWYRLRCQDNSCYQLIWLICLRNEF